MHKLISTEAKVPYLKMGEKRLQHWLECKCPVGGTKTCATVFKSAGSLKAHLRSKVYKLTEEEETKIMSKIRYSTIKGIEDGDDAGLFV